MVGTFVYVKNMCGQSGQGLVAALGDQPVREANTASATWAFSAPAGESLAAATLWRAGDTSGGALLDASYEFSIDAPDEHGLVEGCAYELGCSGAGELGAPFAASNRLELAANRLGSRIFLRAACGGQPEFECPAGKGDANGYAAAIYLYAADLTLEQTAGPSASGAGGELASAAQVAGTSDVTFNATDPGAGVYEAVFNIDGTVVQRSVIDEDGGRCRDVGQTSDGLAAFLYLQPCPQSVSADVPFNTTGIANGSHHLTVSVTDAAGNSAPVLDRMVTIANPGVPGPANGQGASPDARLEARWKSTARATLTGTFGRARTILGRLVNDSGAAISDAQIEATYTPAYAGSKSSERASVRTAADGTFRIVVPGKAPSESVELAYRAHLGDASPAATRTLQLSVPALVSLTVSPDVTGVGQTIYFRGRLDGGPIPKGGKPLILEARAGNSRWIEFDVLRSDGRGHFHASYRFRFAGPVHYQFRVLCEHEADYPYATGASHPVGVFER